jgi:hypothetical protein
MKGRLGLGGAFGRREAGEVGAAATFDGAGDDGLETLFESTTGVEAEIFTFGLAGTEALGAGVAPCMAEDEAKTGASDDESPLGVDSSSIIDVAVLLTSVDGIPLFVFASDNFAVTKSSTLVLTTSWTALTKDRTNSCLNFEVTDSVKAAEG